MKRLFFVFISVCLFSLCYSPTWGANFSSTVSLSSAKEQQYTEQLGIFFEKIIEQRSTSFLKEKFELIHDKIGDLFVSKAKLKDDDIFVLEFIDWTVVQWLNKYGKTSSTSSTTTTKTSTTSSTTTSDHDTANIDAYRSGNKTITIGSVSHPVIKFKVVAELEDIEVETFAIIADDTDFDQIIKNVWVYNKNGDLIGSDRPSDAEAVFDDEFILEKGDNYLYIALEPLDKDDTNKTFQFTLEIRKATGKTSGSDIDPISIENEEDIISIVPVSIGSIELLDKYQGYLVDTRMYNLAKTDLAIISFSPKGNDEIELRSLELTLHDETVAKNIASTLKIQRIDTQSTAIPFDSINDKQITFDLTNFGSKTKVKPGTTMVLLITGTPTLHSSAGESVTIELDSDATSKGIITYTLEDSNDVIGTKSFGYIGDSSVGE